MFEHQNMAAVRLAEHLALRLADLLALRLADLLAEPPVIPKQVEE